MELLDRYLQAIRTLLPKRQQDDITKEMKDDLLSQVEEEESTLNRPLNSLELRALLQRCGHPMLVASRY